MIRVLATFVAVALAASAAGQPVFPTSPDWVSLNPHYSTGAALADLDRDGWLDLVVADGNDILPGRLNVYYNNGDGTLPASASWQSNDLAYNGHLDVADVDGDGWLDVAVAILVNEGGPAAKLYLNSLGTLSSTPVWMSAEAAPAFGVAFGDVDNDGRPDLAVATGWAYGTPHLDRNYVYRNVNGMLEESAGWQSDDTYDHQGALWTDADDDGWLDLVLIAAAAETRIYRNLGGTLETTASWETSDSINQDGIMLAVGDVTGDGHRDLFATDNTQLNGSGRFKQYTGLAEGFFSTFYSWSYYDGYGSAVALADVNADGMLDLATGAWWDFTRIFENTGAGLSPAPSWNSGGTSVVEKIVFGDVDPPCGVELLFTEQFQPDAGRQLFYLPQQPIQRIVSVRRDGVDLEPDEYTYTRESGWVSVSAAPAISLDVVYTYSHSLDMAISNWDGNVGNYLYYNFLFDDCNENGTADGCDIVQGSSDDTNGNGVPDECEDHCPWDLSGDGSVGVTDLLGLLAAWGSDPGGPPDFDGDGFVGISDLLVLLANWGPCP
ncbi:MAG: FG-GAP repeat domain-containing protein [Planctomycetota bacterium]